MNKLLVGAVVAGLVSSSVVLGDGTATADDVPTVPDISAPSDMSLDHTMVTFSDPANVPPEGIGGVEANGEGGTTTAYPGSVAEVPLDSQLRDMGVPSPVADEMKQVLQPMAAGANDDPNPAPAFPPGTPFSGVRNPLAPLAVIPAVTIPLAATSAGLSAAAVTISTIGLIHGVIKGVKRPGPRLLPKRLH